MIKFQKNKAKPAKSPKTIIEFATKFEPKLAIEDAVVTDWVVVFEEGVGWELGVGDDFGDGVGAGGRPEIIFFWENKEMWLEIVVCYARLNYQRQINMGNKIRLS